MLDVSSSLSTTTEKFWKLLWALSVPQITKIFLWRVCLNSLPTCQALAQRSIISCEDFFLCWEVNRSGTFGRSPNYCFFDLHHSNVVSLACKALELLSPLDIRIFALIASTIWHRRHLVVFNGYNKPKHDPI